MVGLRVVAAMTALGAGVLVTGNALASTSSSVPYSDPAQVGVIGLCDSAGHSITEGSLDDVPFVARAVSSSPALAPYDGPGRVAFIDAYQPRQGLSPAEWSGEELISASFYSNPAHPTVVGTRGDISLRQFVEDYPPTWDGLVQLRMFLKVPNAQADVLHYAAVDLKVDGNSWQVARGGNVACDSGQARSVAALLAPKAASGKLNPTPAGGARGPSTSPGSSGATSVSPSVVPSEAGSSTVASSSTSDSHHAAIGWGIVAAVVLASAGGYWVFRRRVARN